MKSVRPMLLGINGLKGSGKNTAAEFLEEWCGDAFVARSQGLADVLKVSAARALGLIDETPEQCIEIMDELKFTGTITTEVGILGTDGPNPDPNHPQRTYRISGREYLQFYGTEAHRQVFADSFWIDHLLPKDKKYLYAKWDKTPGQLTQLMIVTDIRFSNEAGRVKALGGLVIKIRRPEIETGETDSHASEKPLPAHLVDEVIVNDSTLEDLEAKMFAFGSRRIFDGLKSGSGSWN